MSQAPSMPVFWDAYLADTTHLTTEEHGAYLLLLAAMWRRNGWVPDDDRDNARILGLTTAKWRKVKDRLAVFLVIENGHITQKNLLKIWKITQEKIEKNRQNGARGGRPKDKENNDIPKANGSKTDNPKETIPEPEPEPDTTPSGVVGRGELEGLSDRLCEAAGISDVQKSVGHLNLSEPLHWQQSGCDLEMDILPTLRRIAASGKRPASWAYYTKAVFEARDKRLSPSPSVQQQTATNPNRRRSTGDLMREMMERENGRESENLHPGDALRISANAGR